MSDTAEYQKLRTVKESYAAKLAKKTYENRARMMASISEMDARQFVRERSLAKKIIAIPETISGRLASEADARNCEEIIEAAIRAALSYGEP